MKHVRGRGFRGLMLAAATGTVAWSGVAAAQSASVPGADLRRQLGELAANPTSVYELIETGRTALAVGDGEAALGFFTRASQLAPMDPRVKAGLAAANTRSGRPQTALLLFTEAVAAGASVADIAGERGLAFDLIGQPARAQQDYLLSLKQREDPEVRRRLALSLAISGQQEAALRLLDPQVRSGDRAGSRARFMVLALSGDVRGATAAAAASMPPGAAQAVTPFLSRLAALDPGQMAAAVNLGRLPSAGILTAARGDKPSADPAALAFAGGGIAPVLSNRLPVATASNAPRRRPGAVNSAARSPGASDTTRTLASARMPTPAMRNARPAAGSSLTAPVTSNPAAGAAAASTANPVGATVIASSTLPAGFLQPHPYEPLRLKLGNALSAQPVAAAAVEQRVVLAGPSGGPRVPQAELKADEPMLTGAAVRQPAAASQPVQLTQAQLSSTPGASFPQQDAKTVAQTQPVDGAAVNLAVWSGGATSNANSARPSTTAPDAAPASTTASASRLGFSDVAAMVSSLPVESRTERPAARPEAVPARANRANTRSNAAARTTEASARPATPARAKPPAHPSRIWVQLAVSPNRGGLGHDLRRMQRAAPELFKGRTGHVAPIGSSHRLLVGPFEDSAAARTFVNELKQKEISALSWTSPAGTAVERLAAGR